MRKPTNKSVLSTARKLIYVTESISKKSTIEIEKTSKYKCTKNREKP